MKTHIKSYAIPDVLGSSPDVLASNPDLLASSPDVPSSSPGVLASSPNQAGSGSIGFLLGSITLRLTNKRFLDQFLEGPVRFGSVCLA